MLDFRVPEYDKARPGKLLVSLEWCFDGSGATLGYIQVTPMTNGDLPLAHQIATLPVLKAKCERLQAGLTAIEARWREASQNKCFKSHFRQTMGECADELRSLLAGFDDSEIQNEINKAFAEGEL